MLNFFKTLCVATGSFFVESGFSNATRSGFYKMLLIDGCDIVIPPVPGFKNIIGCWPGYFNTTRFGFKSLLADGAIKITPFLSVYSNATRYGFRKCCWWMAVVILMPPVPGFMKCYRLLAMAIVMPPVPGLMHGIGG